MSVKMPEPDHAVLARRAEIVAALRAIVPGEGVIAAEREMRPYESDGLTAYRQLPMVVVLPETTEQVVASAALLPRERHQAWCRAAPAPRSPAARCRWPTACCSAWRKFNRILEIDYDNRGAVVEPGVTNLAITQAVAHDGFYYAPDPSSQIACTIGGNVAENSGGVHCLKYGLTTNNVLGCEMVLINGEVAAPRRQASRRRRLRPARHHHRLGRPARRRHRGDGAHPAEARDRARGAGRLPVVGGRPANASARSSAPASFRAAWR